MPDRYEPPENRPDWPAPDRGWPAAEPVSDHTRWLDAPAAGGRADGLRRLSRLTWRATQLSAITAAAFAVLFARTAPAQTTSSQTTLRPASTPTPAASTRPAATPSPRHPHKKASATPRPSSPAPSTHPAAAPRPSSAPASPTLAPPTTPPAPTPSPSPVHSTSSGTSGG